MLINFNRDVLTALSNALQLVKGFSNRLAEKSALSKNTHLTEKNKLSKEMEQSEQEILNTQARLRNSALSIEIYLDPSLATLLGQSTQRWIETREQALALAQFNPEAATNAFGKIQEILASLSDSKEKYDSIKISLERQIQELEESEDQRQLFWFIAIAIILTILVIIIASALR